MSDEKFWGLMSRYVCGELSLKETEELLEWLGDDPARADLLKEFQDTWDRTKNYPENFKVDTRAAWQKLRTSISVEPPKPNVKTIGFNTWIAIATSMVLVATVGWLLFRLWPSGKLIEVETFAGQHKEVVLPDGSKVWLNVNSSISYADNFNDGSQREVKLKGEAFFEVEKNPTKPFLISTGKTLTTVLGTSFDVKQEKEGTIRVAVVTGKVSFKSVKNPRQELILEPGEAGVISSEGYAGKSKYSDKNFLYWKNKQLNFENVPLSQVIETLEDAYQVSFQLMDSALLERKITASFKEASLTEVTNVLEALFGISIRKSASVYVVEKR